MTDKNVLINNNDSSNKDDKKANLYLEEVINKIKNGEITDKDRIKKFLSELLFSLETGDIKLIEKKGSSYLLNRWIKEGILFIFKYFEIKEFFPFNMEGVKFNDKFDYRGTNNLFRLVPGGTSIRRGTFIDKGVVIMPPSFINVGAYIGANTMIDSLVLVGSCAQIGKNCHISAGTIIGGVLEPPNELPVIIEDNVFIGGNCGIYEGVLVEEGAVIGTGTIINSSTPIIDINTGNIYYKRVPAGSVVIPGGKKKIINGDEYIFQTPLIIKKKEDISDHSKIQLNEILRDFYK
ncbi:MAG: 2,3,4,5-tetrahydropyridine-2,6-dicarboxylate N-succinyltransferase [Spirochaetes bacterium]|nr:2,3,4,5-tetrahydropyridine-2,6-dicarboxylate N-succinyltransferase [Spirochaetota bacterium]